MIRRWGQVTSQPEVKPVASGAQMLELRKKVDAVHVAESIQAYIVALVRATRILAAKTEESARAPKTLSFGASPRACLGLFQASKALAWIRGSEYVTPALVQDVFLDVMRHRVGLTYEAESLGITPDEILGGIIKQTAVPESGLAAV